MLKLIFTIKFIRKVHNKVTSNRRVNINPFSTNVPLIYPPENLGFSDVFRVYRKMGEQ